MKLIKGILGCALATGLATFATTPAQAAGTVIENTLYTPLNITFVVQYVDGKGHVQNLSANSKQIIKLLGFPSSYQLATDYDGFGDGADVFVISKDSVITDLSSDDTMDINFNDLVQKNDKSGKNGSFNQSERGIFSITFDSSNIILSGIAANAAQINPNDTYAFEASGVYTFTASGGKVSNNGDQKISTQLEVIRITGDGSDNSSEPTIKSNVTTSTPVGDFLIKNGEIKGSGGGTVNVE